MATNWRLVPQPSMGRTEIGHIEAKDPQGNPQKTGANEKGGELDDRAGYQDNKGQQSRKGGIEKKREIAKQTKKKGSLG